MAKISRIGILQLDRSNGARCKRSDPQSLEQECSSQACPGTFAGSEAKIEQWFQTQTGEHCAMGDLPAQLAGHEVRRHSWINEHRNQCGNRSGQAIENDRRTLFARAKTRS